MNKLNIFVFLMLLLVYNRLGGECYHNKCLSDGYDRVNAKFLKESFRKSNGTNIVTCPLSTILLLSLYSGGAPGAVREQIVSNLGSNNYTEINQLYSVLSRHYSSLNPSYFVLANKILFTKQHNLTESFKQIGSYYNTAIDAADFSNREEVMKSINIWAEDITGGKIVKPIKGNFISPDLDVALLNIALFQGHLDVPFKREETTLKDFYLDRNNVVQKPTMRIRTQLRYHESTQLDAKMVRLPYKESGFEMLIVLPNQLEDLPRLLHKMEEFGLMDDVRGFSSHPSYVDFTMPRLDITSSFHRMIDEILSLIGFSKIFTDNASEIFRENYVKMTKVFQAACIKVNEEGSSAGGVTGFGAGSWYPTQRYVVFNVNRPFVFAVLYGNTIAFIGAYVA